MATNQEIEDLETRHQTFSDRQTSALVNFYTVFLKRAERPLYFGDADVSGGINEIYTVRTQEDAQNLTQAQRNRFISRLRNFYGSWYAVKIEKAIFQPLQMDLFEKADNEADFQSRALTKQLKTTFNKPSVPAVKRAFSNGTYLGNPYDNFVDQYRNITLNRLIDYTTQQINQGATAADIIAGIRSGPDATVNYKQNITRLDTHIRTAAKHAETSALQATYAKNSNKVAGWRFFNPLDSKTSQICATTFTDLSNNGTKVWPIGQGPLPPLHFQCRSQSIPAFKRGVL